mgnify:CR=1 FL=1
MKNLLIFTIATLLFQLNLAQNSVYQSLILDQSLTQNANSAIRNYSTHITIESTDEMLIEHKQIITVFNKNGDKDIDAYLYYDENIKVKKLEAKVFDTFGNEIKKFKKRDFRDYSAVNGGTLYSDSRIYILDYTPIDYPYTVEYTYTIENSNTAFIRPWRPVRNYYQSVEFSEFIIDNKTSSELRHKSYNINFFKGINVNESGDSISCKTNNLHAIRKESYSPSLNSFSPKVNFALSEFTLEGVSGKATNWQEMGKWQYEKLIKGRDEVSEKTKNEILFLTQGIDDPLEKVKIVYKYVQDNTRYISVQVGIGGWQPIEALKVDEVKYGDCKGLTNYTKSLLKVVGVNANYSVVFAGSEKRDIDEDFASMQGNHVILNVPLEDQDLWLECTSQDIPFGFLGNFTDDRKVLVIDENGGKIKSTDSYYANENYQKTQADVKLDDTGDLEASFSIISEGIQFDNKYRLAEKTEKEIHKYYKSNYAYLKSLSIESYDFSNNKEKVEFIENIKFSSHKYCSKFGNRFMFKPNVLNQSIKIPNNYDQRMTPFVISRGFHDNDHLVFSIPEEMQIEFLPKPFIIETKFGEYKASIQLNEEEKLVYKRSLLVKQGKFSKEDYQNYRNFMKAIRKADNLKVILIKKT